MKRLIKSFWFYILSALGNALTVRAGIGVGSFLSLNVALADWLGLSVGWLTAGFNLFFLIICLLLDKKRQYVHYVLMVVALFFQAKVIDFFLYQVLNDLPLSNYVAQLVCFILGVILTGYGLGRVLAYHVLEFPIERFCQLMAQRTARSFKQYRYAIDIACVLLSIIISSLFGQVLAVREGTLLSMLMLAGIIAWSKQIKIKL